MHSGCSSQPEHDRVYLCTHSQLLHLPLKRLLPEFMKNTTRFPGWIRAGAAFLFLNFNNFLAAVSKLFYRQSHFHVTPLLRFALPDLRALLQKLLLYGPMCSPHSFSLHPHLPCTPTSHPSPLRGSPSAPFLRPSLAPLPCRCCHASFMSACLRYPISPKKTLAAFSKSLQNFLCPSPASLCASSQTVQLHFGIALCHEWQNLLLTVLRFQEVKKSVSKETGVLLDCFIGENYRERRSKAGACTGKFDHLLGIAL